MNKLRTSLILSTLVASTALWADWLPIADFSQYTIGDLEDDLLAKGWIFQDDNYYGFPTCTDGTLDCTGYREIVEAPYNPTHGSDKAILIRAGDPEQGQPINAASRNFLLLPEEIPVGTKATIYMSMSVERIEGSRVWGYTPEIPDSILGTPDDTKNDVGYGDLNMAMSWSQNSDINVHAGGYVPAALDGQNALTVQTWYEFWFHIDNQDPASGDTLGGRFDIYIQGGSEYPEQTKLPNTLEDFRNANFEQWLFRRNLGESIKAWAINTGTGNPDTNYQGTSAIFINDLQLYNGEFTLDRPNAVVDNSKWGGYDIINAAGDVDTGDWLGWINVASAPYIFSYNLGWIYMVEPSSASNGEWTYIYK